jgi:hypothetical protein
MRAAVVTGLALAAALAAAGLSSTGHARGRPALKLAGTRPVTVHGSGFQAGERIRLVLRKPSGASTRRVRASRRGKFSARFPRATIRRCAGFSVKAAGRGGSRAALLRRPALACPPR